MGKDPLKPSPGAANRGSAALSRGVNSPVTRDMWELGEVVFYDSSKHVSTVKTHSGKPLENVPQIKATATSYDHLQTGTTVVIFWGLGSPMILGCIDMVGPRQAAIPSITLTGIEGVGANDPTQFNNSSHSYKPPGAPTDMGPGDWAQVGSLGNHVAVLEGGVTLLGSKTAHVQSMGNSGVLRSVARRLESFSDFGFTKTDNSEGRTSFVLRAGSSQATQTGKDEQNWTIRLDLGAEGDIFNFRIYEPEGRIIFRMHVGSDGRLEIYGDGGADISSGNKGSSEMRSDIAGDHVLVVEGDAAHTYQGEHTVTVERSLTTHVAKDIMTTAAGTETRLVSGDKTEAIGGSCDETIGNNYTAKIGSKYDVSAQNTVAIKAQSTNTLDGAQIKLGDNASQPLIKGLDFQSSVMNQLSAAGSVATIAGLTSQATIAPDAFLGSATSLTVTAVSQIATALSSIGNLLSSAASAYAGTLSTKTKTE